MVWYLCMYVCMYVCILLYQFSHKSHNKSTMSINHNCKLVFTIPEIEKYIKLDEKNNNSVSM